MLVYSVGGGAPGINPNSLTALPGDVAKGKVAGVKDNYDPVMGTLELTGNAVANHVLAGETFYNNNLYAKQTGTMTVQSILSFSVAPYTASQMIFTWKNPAMGPFSGVIIVGKTGGYPANVNDGTRYYKGWGNNSNANGTSNAVIGGFATNVTYYFRAYGYTVMNGSEWIHTNGIAGNAMIKLTTLTFTSSTTWTVPAGINQVEAFVAGGGGAGGDGYWDTGSSVTGSGGGGGYTVTQTVNVTPGQQISIIVGSGGEGYYGPSDYFFFNSGGQSSFGSVVAKGGYGGAGGRKAHSVPGPNTTPEQAEGQAYKFGDGGSGGGAGGAFETDTRDHLYVNPWGADGGSNGANGGTSGLYNIVPTGETTESGSTIWTYGNQMRESVGEGGRGQGRTTRAFGDPNGTLYCPGGGGGGGGKIYFTNNGTTRRWQGSGGNGGAIGGGKGGSGYTTQTPEANGTPNTGAGGGGGGGRTTSVGNRQVGAGGSGIVIIKFLG